MTTVKPILTPREVQTHVHTFANEDPNIACSVCGIRQHYALYPTAVRREKD